MANVSECEYNNEIVRKMAKFRFWPVRVREGNEERMDKIYKVVLNGAQYSVLEKMLCSYRAHQLARNQVINGYELFRDLMDDICSPVTDGWCTYKVLLQELEQEHEDKQRDLLRFLTRQVFPGDEDYFIKQIGKNFHCSRDFSFLIELKF